MIVTKRELKKLSSPACHPRYVMTVPAGTRCARLGDQFVVDDTSKVVGGNAHDLAHYFIWLLPGDVEEVST